MMTFCGKLFRKKIISKDESPSQLNRVLSTLDLTLLGIGSTLGIGVYVLAGSVAKDAAGPAVVISFLVAAAASVLAGLCYAEFGSRVPQAGSAYVYSYVCVGEIVAFIVGWNLIMEYVIGVASVAKGYSGYVDQLFEHKISHAFQTYLPINLEYLSNYFDAFAFSITLVLTFLLAFGVKESSLFNNIFTVLNLFVVVFVVIAGSIYAKPKNWFLNKDVVLNTTNATAEQVGEGGFAPFGFHGIMKGAATCFYGFVGFDAIATTGEEAKNPQRSIPLAIIFSLFFVFLAYFGISTVVTMMVPYYLQDPEAPLPQAFHSVDFTVGQWIVTIGALFGLSTSLLGSMFPMPRVIYSMASDGVLFSFLAKVHPKFQTPLIATLLAGTFGGLMAAIFKLDALIDMMSIGTLTAYTLVAISVLCMRYRKDEEDSSEASITNAKKTIGNYVGQIFNETGSSYPTELSSAFTNLAVIFYCFSTIVFCYFAIFSQDEILNGDVLQIGLLSIFAAAMIFTLMSLSFQPVSPVKLAFKVPCLPWVPGLSILSNTYLIMKLSGITWVRFSVWMGFGFIIYGICLWNGTADRSYEASLESKKKRKYSRVSATGFHNAGFDLANGRSIDVTQLNEKGNRGTKTETQTLALKDLSMSQGRDTDGTGQKDQTKNQLSTPDAANSSCKFNGVETETIEKTLEFGNEGESLGIPVSRRKW